MRVILKTPVQDFIRIRGARVHNLKNISLSIPHDQLTVVTGVSGSGKSSLAFDTIYAEGQRRYVESLSAYARQFLERMEKPDVDEIDGIAPAVAIRQKNTTRNPRSTVATSTECYDFLRLLYARVGQTFCPKCGTRVRKDTRGRSGRAAARAAGRARAGTRCFPCGEHASARGAARPSLRTPQEGLQPPVPGRAHVRILHARIAARHRFLPARVSAGGPPGHRAPDLHQRLVDTIEICYREAGEVIFRERRRGGAASCASTRSSSARPAAWSSPSPSRSLFSFNSPVGACPRCQGFGNTIDFDMDRVIPDRTLSLDDGAVDPWTKPQVPLLAGQFPEARQGQRPLRTCPSASSPRPSARPSTRFIRRFFDHLETKKYKLHVRVFLSRYRGYALCPDCKGARLRKEALYVRVGGKNLADVVRMNIAEAHEFFDALELSPEETAIADKILVEIRQRLKFLNDVGLEYLTLDRLLVHALRRRGAAHPTGHLPGLAPGGRLLRAGRAFHRPAQRATPGA